MKRIAAFFLLVFLLGAIAANTPGVFEISRSVSVDSLGACQGASYIDGKVFLYGDREVGVIREYTLDQDSLIYFGKEYRLTLNGQDLINHPTGIAHHGRLPVFIGNSIRLNKEGTLWKAVIYQVNWKGLKNKGVLDGNLVKTIEDDACIQGTRPEYVRYKGKWYVATADYGDKRNEVRLYDSERLKKAVKTSEPGVLFKKFSCGAWVQNLHWVNEKGILILIQNQIEGRRWRYTFLDLEKSLDTGQQQVIRIQDMDQADELEGFTMTGSGKGMAVTSSRKQNVHFMTTGF
ncbi:hypothetical protein DYBT9275_00564 [Dyadobacter sp. CECT 9275]|uniref:Glutamine cyclotransferase n=1 Tax=Dyadobacter helix TaxID=2822344 RepID=A0A916J9N8_9BACT|nr:hypothetical protein [Dyadobacter sp. CECT 9275]CAG4990592.1 hypothetical protein DYBT9275_00564 [Dyadobacter sp. CECT 9275]